MTDLFDPNPADDPELAALVQDFVAKLPDRAAAIADAQHAGGCTTVARLAHQLVGAAACYGFPAVASAARRVEDLAKAGDRSIELADAIAAVGDVCRNASAG